MIHFSMSKEYWNIPQRGIDENSVLASFAEFSENAPEITLQRRGAAKRSKMSKSVLGKVEKRAENVKKDKLLAMAKRMLEERVNGYFFFDLKKMRRLFCP